MELQVTSLAYKFEVNYKFGCGSHHKKYKPQLCKISDLLLVDVYFVRINIKNYININMNAVWHLFFNVHKLIVSLLICGTYHVVCVSHTIYKQILFFLNCDL